MGHQVSPPYPVSILTSALMAYLNNGMAVYEMGMAGNAMEKIVIRDLAKRFGLPDGATGFVTSGGTLGNLTALMAARAKYLQNNPTADYKKLAILVSEEAHYSVERTFVVMGIPCENIVKVSVDEQFNIRADQLEELYQTAKADGKEVFCVIGCACSTATGSFDDLVAIGTFAERHHLWFHVDAAHGGPVIFSPRYAHLINGIDKADSLIMDFHKMMMVPSLSTAVIFRSQDLAGLTFTQEARYLWQDQQSEEWYNSGKRTFECTKPMTIIHVYALLRLYGDRLFREQIEQLYDLAKSFAELLDKQEGFELLCKPQSNIVCFRCVREGTDPDELNRSILKKIMLDGRFYIVGTTTNKAFYLRTSLMNTRTDLADLKFLLQLITDTTASNM